MRAWPKEKSAGAKPRFRFLAGLYLLGCCLVLSAPLARSQPFGGIVALTVMDFKGNNVTIDSFDSTTNAHSIWQTNWLYRGQPYGVWSNSLSFVSNSTPSRTANITVATDGSIINVGNANIAGYVDTAPGGAVSINLNGYVGDLAWVFTSSGSSPGNATQNIQPGHQRDDMNVLFFSSSLPRPLTPSQTTWWPVPQPANGTKIRIGGTWTNISGTWTNFGGTLYTNTSSGLTIGGITYTLFITNKPANSNCVFYSMNQLANSLFIDGQNVVLYLTNGLNYGVGDILTLNTNADVQIWSSGDIATSWSSTINNLTKNARAFSVYDVAGSSLNISLTGNGFGVGLLYTPSSHVQFSGGGSSVYDIVGAIFCHDMAVNGHYNFHFDEALAIRLPPWIISQPTNRILQAGSSGSYTNPTFNVTSGGFFASYQWFFNQTNPIPTASEPFFLMLTNVQPTNAGNYTVVVTNIYGAITSDPASLVVWTDATPTLSAVFVPTNGQFQFNITGVTGLNYAVQTSTNLIDWIPLQTNVSPFSFTDTNMNVSPQQFYRSVFSP